MLTKDYLKKIKKEGGAVLSDILNSGIKNNEIIFILDNLGRIPANFKGDAFIPLLDHPNDKIRLLTRKKPAFLLTEEFIQKCNKGL